MFNKKNRCSIYKPSKRLLGTALVMVSVNLISIAAIHNSNNSTEPMLSKEVYYNTEESKVGEDKSIMLASVMPAAKLFDIMPVERNAGDDVSDEISILSLEQNGDGLAGERLRETKIVNDKPIVIKESEELLAEMEHEKMTEMIENIKREEAEREEKERKKQEKESIKDEQVVTIEQQKKQSKKIEEKSKGKDSNKTKEDKAEYVYTGLTDEQKKQIKKSIDKGAKDSSYHGEPIQLSGYERTLLENLVFGEAGGEGFVGQVLVAQTVHDEMIKTGIKKVSTIIKRYSYSGSTTSGTSESCKNAVAYVFDEGGYGVQHRLIYFYAPGSCRSSFHEKQNFVVHWKKHRFFDDW